MKKKFLGGIALGLLGVFSLASCNLTITDNSKKPEEQSESGACSDTQTETFSYSGVKVSKPSWINNMED